MASVKDILFSVNEYDKDGDLIEEGIYLHFGNTKVKVSDNLEDFSEIDSHMKSMIKEIVENRYFKYFKNSEK